MKITPKFQKNRLLTTKEISKEFSRLTKKAVMGLTPSQRKAFLAALQQSFMWGPR